MSNKLRKDISSVTLQFKTKPDRCQIKPGGQLVLINAKQILSWANTPKSKPPHHTLSNEYAVAK